MSSTPTETIRALHVDDDPAFAALTAAYLPRERPEISVTSVDSPVAALARLEEKPPDCVVSDYDMPGRSGLSLLRDVRETHPELPFVLFTGKGSEEVAAEAI
jgi:CheY-like chemotaxis protein